VKNTLDQAASSADRIPASRALGESFSSRLLSDIERLLPKRHTNLELTQWQVHHRVVNAKQVFARPCAPPAWLLFFFFLLGFFWFFFFFFASVCALYGSRWSQRDHASCDFDGPREAHC